MTAGIDAGDKTLRKDKKIKKREGKSVHWDEAGKPSSPSAKGKGIEPDGGTTEVRSRTKKEKHEGTEEEAGDTIVEKKEKEKKRKRQHGAIEGEDTDPERVKKRRNKRHNGTDDMEAEREEEKAAQAKPEGSVDVEVKRKKKKRKVAEVENITITETSTRRSSNPKKDETLGEQARKALIYAYTKHKHPSSWKFNKARQNWLIRNVWSDQAIPENYVPLTIKYLSEVKGGAREALITTCRDALQVAPSPSQDPLQKTDAQKDAVDTSSNMGPDPVKQQRARDLLAALETTTTHS